MNDEVITLTWPNLGDAPEKAGVYAWYVRMHLGDADLDAFEREVERARASGQPTAPIVEEMLQRHFFHPFQENAYAVRLSGALKPRYVGELAHEPTRSEALIQRLGETPSRLRPIARALRGAAPHFTAPLYIGMASNLRKRLDQHKKLIKGLPDNRGGLLYDERVSGFAKQVVARGFNPTQLFVACMTIGDVENDEHIDLENILNRINFPIFGRN